MKTRQSYFTLPVFSLLLLLGSDLNAQDTAGDKNSAENDQFTLEEVMVTAQKRVESLQEVLSSDF